MDRLFIIVPVFNEALNITTLFEGFSNLREELKGGFSLQYILVDDGSDDGTVMIAKQETKDLDLVILQHEKNIGPGAAFATGFTYLSKCMKEEDWVITMEGDNTSKYELIKQMLVRSNEGFDMVFASPYMYGGGFTKTSFLRKLLSSGANLVVKDLLGIQGILTASSFFRLYRAKALMKMQRVFGPGILERFGFESMVEMVMKIVMLRMTLSEVAMELDSSLRKGKSKMKFLRTIKGYLALWSYKKGWLKKLEKTKHEVGFFSTEKEKQDDISSYHKRITGILELQPSMDGKTGEN
jgi:dolichol-phosphate mannosyltransferase